MLSTVAMGSGIKHLLVEQPSTFDVLAKAIWQLDDTQLDFYLSMGCFYLNKTRLQNLQQNLHPGDYLRFHSNPRRFLIPKVNWSEAIVFEDEEVLVVNKPAGIPVHPTVDNLSENLQAILQRELHREIYVTHRLDVNTSGLIIYAKNKKNIGKINQHFENGEVQKKYLARVPVQPILATGVYTDFMKPEKACPKQMAPVNPGSWLECQLKVLESHSTADSLQEIKIQLITGRTHQIRAQLSYRGLPIFGDQLYGSPVDIHGNQSDLPLGKQNSEAIALCCYSLKLPNYETWSITPTFCKLS